MGSNPALPTNPRAWGRKPPRRGGFFSAVETVRTGSGATANSPDRAVRHLCEMQWEVNYTVRYHRVLQARIPRPEQGANHEWN